MYMWRFSSIICEIGYKHNFFVNELEKNTSAEKSSLHLFGNLE